MVSDPSLSILINAYISSLQSTMFFWSVITQLLATYSKLLQEVSWHIVVEFLIIGKKKVESKKPVKE